MEPEQYIAIAVVVLVAGYLIYRVKTWASVTRSIQKASIAAVGQRDRMDVAISASQENTDAVRENSALLRELIDVNRKLLEKQDGPKY